MRVATIVGNRPQFVKAAAVSRALRASHEEVLIHTGQHHDENMSQVFFDELAIPRPNHLLGIAGSTNTAQTARMIAALEPVMREAAPDVALVYGDTNSTLAGALVAAQARIPLAHVEAGMRSFDRSMPEELNRVLTDHAADLLLCSTQTAVENLMREGVSAGVCRVGDVMADIALAWIPAARRRPLVADVQPGEYVLLTAHRPGNVDRRERLDALVSVIEAVALPVVFPMHPRTRARLEEFGLGQRLAAAGDVHVTEPLGYLDLLALACSAKAVLTDSGGLQKEAYLAGTPCITLRDRTEWVETVDVGWNALADLDADAVLDALERPPPAQRPDLYGDGRAAEKIVEELESAVTRWATP